MKAFLTFVSVIIVGITLYLNPKSPLGEKGVFVEPITKHHDIAFTNVSVIPMTGDGLVLENYTVLVEHDRIVAVGPTGEVDISSAGTVIDGSGKYLMPGLSEMHGHVPQTGSGNSGYVESTLFLYVAAGITTVRGMLGYDHQLELKDRVNSGELVGPNLYLAGPSFRDQTVDSPEQARDRVLQQKEDGWDLLKIHPGLTLAEYDAMARTAHEVEIPFGGHVPADVGVVHAIEAGQLTIDHIDGYTAYLSAFEGAEREQKMAEVIQLTLEHGTWIVPTQALWETIIGAADYDALKKYDELKYIPQQVRNGYNNWVTNNIDNNSNLNINAALNEAALRQTLLSEMNKAGVNILMGTDAPQLFSVPGFSIHRELAKMAEAGMTPYEIIKTGTVNVGQYFNDKDTFGTIEKGMRADLILVNSNPLENVANIKDHSGVMTQGVWLSKADIDKKLSEIEAEYY